MSNIQLLLTQMGKQRARVNTEADVGVEEVKYFWYRISVHHVAQVAAELLGIGTVQLAQHILSLRAQEVDGRTSLALGAAVGTAQVTQDPRHREVIKNVDHVAQ